MRRIRSRSSRLTALLGATAVCAAVGAAGIATQRPAPKEDDVRPAAERTATVSIPLADAPPALVTGDQPPVAGADVMVKEFSSDATFSIVGVTWAGQADGTTYVRAQDDRGGWGPWYGAERAEAATGTSGGTDPLYVGDTRTVQIAFEAPRGGAAGAAGGTGAGAGAGPDVATGADAGTEANPAAPTVSDAVQPIAAARDAQAVLLSPDTSGIEEVPQSGFPLPGVITREQWGAGESCPPQPSEGGTSAGIVHHTAGSNDYSPEDSAAIVRGIWQYHTNTLGWCDIGYQALVDKYGQIFEGRAGGFFGDISGAHTGRFNENTFGVSMVGNYEAQAPTEPQLEAVGRVLGWKLQTAGVDPLGHTQHFSEGTEFTYYPQGVAVDLPNIFGHSDVGYTSCPGVVGYQYLDDIRRRAATYDGSAAGSVALPPGLPSLSDLPVFVPAALSPEDPGAIAGAWRGLGGPAGLLGQALSGEQEGDRGARFVKFERGAVYWHPDTGAQALWGALGDNWVQNGAERGELGLPKSGEYRREDGQLAVDFEGGVLVFNPADGSVHRE